MSRCGVFRSSGFSLRASSCWTRWQARATAIQLWKRGFSHMAGAGRDLMACLLFMVVLICSILNIKDLSRCCTHKAVLQSGLIAARRQSMAAHHCKSGLSGLHPHPAAGAIASRMRGMPGHMKPVMLQTASGTVATWSLPAEGARRQEGAAGAWLELAVGPYACRWRNRSTTPESMWSCSICPATARRRAGTCISARGSRLSMRPGGITGRSMPLLATPSAAPWR